MREWKFGEECEHGHLGRKCEICERDDEIEELKAERDELRAEMERLRAAMTEIARTADEAGAHSVAMMIAGIVGGDSIEGEEEQP